MERTAVVSILHISDLHFGIPHRPAAAEAVLQTIGEVAPTAVVCTGDIVDWAEHRGAWRAAAAFFERIERPLLTIPGNHDIPRVDLFNRALRPFGAFDRHVHDERDPVLSVEGAVIAGIDTPRRWSADLGYVDDDQLARTADRIAAAPAGALRIVALHHPLAHLGIPLPRAHVWGHRRVQSALANMGADIALTGHNHWPHVERLGNGGRSFVWAQAGTASASRLRAFRCRQNSITLLRASADHLSVQWWYHELGEPRFAPGETMVFDRS